jgi:hypothetical protein
MLFSAVAIVLGQAMGALGSPIMHPAVQAPEQARPALPADAPVETVVVGTKELRQLFLEGFIGGDMMAWGMRGRPSNSRFVAEKAEVGPKKAEVEPEKAEVDVEAEEAKVEAEEA